LIRRRTFLSSSLFLLAAAPAVFSQQQPRFRVLALAERGNSDHQGFVNAAKLYLSDLAAREHFAVDYIGDTAPITQRSLAQYRLFLQLNYPPYKWTPAAHAAMEDYLTRGLGGWIGFHHAALLGDFDGTTMSPWFSQFMGGIRYTSYIPGFVTATVDVDDRTHPVMRGVPRSFVVRDEEWYTWSQSPRPNVRVLATVDESTYSPDSLIKMGGDHPVIWSNEHYKARNVYIFMGHHADLFQNGAFVTIFHNAIEWASAHP
jgi:uncharacterized protein